MLFFKIVLIMKALVVKRAPVADASHRYRASITTGGVYPAQHVPVAQPDRARGFGPHGCGLKSCQAHFVRETSYKKLRVASSIGRADPS